MLTTVSAVAAVVASVLPSVYAAPPYNPEYYANPWPGVCATGKMQTPIDIPADFRALPEVPQGLVTEMSMPRAQDVVVKNVGNSIQMTWDAAKFLTMDDKMFPMVAAGGSKISDVLLDGIEPEFRLKMIPLQVHWHAPSEHTWDGLLGGVESHIVTAVGPGEAPEEWGCDAVWEGGDPVLEKCIAVFGTIYREHEGSSPGYIDDLLNTFPTVTGTEAKHPSSTFDIMRLLPENKSYYTYIGSLTTPPCSEGLRWHVFNEHKYLSYADMTRMEALLANSTDSETGKRQLYRHNNRPIQPLNGRDVWFHDFGKAKIPGVTTTMLEKM